MYNEFAYFYDELNGAANYKRLHRFIRRQFRRLGLRQGVVADLGCGTGTLSLALARDGYEVLAIDLSVDMLEVLADKLATRPKLAAKIQPLCQDLCTLDLFGTVQGAVSTFDTLDHIGPWPRFAQALARAALFMDAGAVFIFDMNTPYKHRQVLAGHSYRVQTPQTDCHWQNCYDATAAATQITVRICRRATGETFEERFTEYSYTPQQVQALCGQLGLRVLRVLDGETFRPLRPCSQRMLFVTQKQYTQLGDGGPVPDEEEKE